MSLLNGVRVVEAIELKSTLDTNNPLIGTDEMQLSYDSIVSGVYQGVKARVGPGNWNDLTDIFNNAGAGKIPKSYPGSVMPADNVFIYTLTSGDVSALGSSISVTGFMVNNSDFPVNYSFSGNQGSLVAGDTISFSGLPAKIYVTTINFILI